MASEDEKRETVADILAEMRIFKCRNLSTGELEICAAIANFFADRIEAAWKREKDELVYAYDPTKAGNGRLPEGSAYALEAMREPVTELHAVGNAAAMRDALDAALRFIGNLKIEPYSPLDEDASELRQRIMDALSAPPRNCDVGTAEEQGARFVAWQYSKPLRTEFGLGALEWAQMPYEAQEGDAK